MMVQSVSFGCYGAKEWKAKFHCWASVEHAIEKIMKIFINMLPTTPSSSFSSILALSETIEKFDNRKKSNQLDEWVKKEKILPRLIFNQLLFCLRCGVYGMAIHIRATIIDN